MQLGSKGVQSEINITPLIDVVLVLLIIFMVVVPLVEQRFVLAVPESDVPDEEEIPEDSPQALLVKLGKDGTVFLNKEALPLEQMVDKLRGALKRRDEKVVFFDADDDANFGLAVDTMDAVRGAGAKHIGVIDPDATADELPTAPGETDVPSQVESSNSAP